MIKYGNTEYDTANKARIDITAKTVSIYSDGVLVAYGDKGEVVTMFSLDKLFQNNDHGND